MLFSRFARMLPMLFALVLLAGCAGSTATLGDWQAAASQQVGDAANHDPNTIRARPESPDTGRRLFSVIGGPYPQHSTDVHGLLVGHRVVHGQPWSIFVVGVVDQRRPRDIRLAAMTGPEPRWRISPPNPDALAAYREARSQPDAGPRPYPGWPAEDDIYTLHIDGSTVTVVESRSGARWELALEQE